jgi:hypothetical protein
MDYMSRLYQNKAIQLQEQIDFLEAQLKYMAEDAPASTFSGTGKGQQAFSDSQLEDQMYRQKRTGAFGSKIEDDKQNQEYKDAKAELDRRRGAKPTTTEAPAQVSGTNRSDPDVQRGQRPIYPEGQSDSTYTKPKTQSTRQTPDTLDLYNLRKKEDSGLQGELNKGFGMDWLGQSGKDDRGDLVAVPSPAPKPIRTVGLPGPVIPPPPLPAPKDSDSGMDPKGLLLGLGGGLYAGNKIREYINRQRVSPKPANLGSTVPTGQDPVKPTGQDPVKPSGQDPVKPSGQDPIKPKVQEGIPKSGSWTFDIPAQAEYMQNPAEWSMPNQHGRDTFPGADAGGRTPDGKYVKDRNTKAGVERARGTPLEGGFGTATAGEPPVYPQGSYSTPEGKVVTPQAAQGTRMSGSQVTSKIPTASFGAKAGNFVKGVVADTPAMVVGGELGTGIASAGGAGRTDAEVVGTAASLAAPVVMGALGLASLPVAGAVATGYAIGKAGEYVGEKSGLGDITRREQVRAAMAKNAEAMKGVKSAEDKVLNPQTGQYMTTKQSAEATRAQAKTERATDMEKAFATPEEAAEHYKNMKNPEYRKRHEQNMDAARIRAIEKEEGGSAYSARIADNIMPDWMANAGESMTDAWHSIWGSTPVKKGSSRGMPYQ